MHPQWLIYPPCDLALRFESSSSKARVPPTPKVSLGKSLVESGCEGTGQVPVPRASSLRSAAAGRGDAGGRGAPRGGADPPSPRRFIQQVNLAAVTIQRWYRRHSQRHRAAAAALGRLLASKREVGPVRCLVARTLLTPLSLAGGGI